MAKENAKPNRLLAGQATRLSRTMHDIRYDAVHDEFFVTNPFAHAVLAYRGGANGDEAPIRIIQGPGTRLGDVGHDPALSPDYQYGVDRLDIDPIHNEIFVPARDKVLVYSRTANGDAAPIRVLHGPDTRLGFSARSIAVDPVRNLIVVGCEKTLLVFNRTDQGNVKPRGVITGPDVGSVKRGGNAMGGSVIHIAPKGWIVTVVGYAKEADGSAYIGIWNINDHGNIAPRWKLGGPQSTLLRPRGISLNPRDKEVYVADMYQNAILTYYFPEIF